MSAKYKLTYFDGRGRAEISRLVCTLGGIAFDDDRISFEQWGQMKASTPMGQLPVLRVKDKGLEICQTSAIATYLAKQCGLYGKTPEDAAMIDMVFEKYKELFDHLASASFAKTEEEKKDLIEKFVAKLPQLENFVAKRKKKGDKFIVNNELGLADLVVFNLMDNEKNIPGRDAYPRPATLDAIYTEVGKNPVIQQYVAKRKETPF